MELPRNRAWDGNSYVNALLQECSQKRLFRAAEMQDKAGGGPKEERVRFSLTPGGAVEDELYHSGCPALREGGWLLYPASVAIGQPPVGAENFRSQGGSDQPTATLQRRGELWATSLGHRAGKGNLVASATNDMFMGTKFGCNVFDGDFLGFILYKKLSLP